MIKLKSLLVERIDYQDTAEQLVKDYRLRTRVKIGNVRGGNKADYDWVKDIINLKKKLRINCISKMFNAIDIARNMF